jgi:hypothetical protein
MFESDMLAVTIETTKMRQSCQTLGMVQLAMPHVDGAPGIANGEPRRQDGFDGQPLELTVLGLNSGTSMVRILLILFIEYGVLTTNR